MVDQKPHTLTGSVFRDLINNFGNWCIVISFRTEFHPKSEMSLQWSNFAAISSLL